MKCAFERQSEWLVCGRCGRRVRTILAPDKCFADCRRPEEIIPCTHRGEVLRNVTCKLCGGREIEVDVYACTLHGECTLRRTKAGDDYRCCLSCGDRAE